MLELALIKAYILLERANPPELKDGEYAVPMRVKKKNRKVNPKTNRMKNFKKIQYHITTVAPKERTLKNIPRYADGKAKVNFIQWLGINPVIDGNHGKGTDGKWYGWSHRAVHGFRPGDRVTGDNLGKKVIYGKYTKAEVEAIKAEKEKEAEAAGEKLKAFYLPKVGELNYDNATYEKDFVIKDDAHAKQVAKTFADNVS